VLSSEREKKREEGAETEKRKERGTEFLPSSLLASGKEGEKGKKKMDWIAHPKDKKRKGKGGRTRDAQGTKEKEKGGKRTFFTHPIRQH